MTAGSERREATRDPVARPFVSIHAHFYQPPRESPWLRAVPRQPSAAPAHDWNERVAQECYSPCRAARLLDERDRVRRMVNLYEHLSFDVGPTLFRWLASEVPETASAAIAGDRAQALRPGGLGGAIAQPYHHRILPLTPARDRRTEIHWGLCEFRARFGRDAVGLWLPECAVDVATLEDAVAAGVEFVILGPGQAARVRPFAGEGVEATASWTDVTAETLDVTRLYVARLSLGRTITIAFYDGTISHDLAFGDLLESGARLAGCLRDRAVRALDAGPREAPPLILAAVDGETFGHHHRFGEMALAWAFEDLSRDDALEVGSVEAYVDRWPATWEVEIREPSAWSCAHGVERWRSDCGCETGGEPGWHQRWRAPLRAALEGLREQLDQVFEQAGREVLRDPWEARQDLWELLVEPTPEAEARFLARHAPAATDGAARRRALGLLDLQRHALAMFTSCGWFFADLAGVEPVQNLQHAAYAIDLALRWGGVDLEPAFREALAAAPGNQAALSDGRVVYDRRVVPCRVAPSTLGRILAARLAAGAWRWHLARSGGRAGEGAPHLPAQVYGLVVEGVEAQAAAAGGVVAAAACATLLAPGGDLEVPVEVAAVVGREAFGLWASVGEAGAVVRAGFPSFAAQALERFRAGGVEAWTEAVERRLGERPDDERLTEEERVALGEAFEAAALDGLAQSADVWLAAVPPRVWAGREAGQAGDRGLESRGVDGARLQLYAVLVRRALAQDPPALDLLARLPAGARGAVRGMAWVSGSVRGALRRAAHEALRELRAGGASEAPAIARLLALLRLREELAPRSSLWETQSILWPALESARAAPAVSPPLLDDLAAALGFSASLSDEPR